MRSWEYIGELERPLVVSQDRLPESFRGSALAAVAPVAAGLSLSELTHSPGSTLWLDERRPGGAPCAHERLTQRRAEARAALPRALAEVKQVLERSGLEGELTARVKQLSSAVQKMSTEKLDPDALEDLLGIRIVVATTAQCYSVLRVLHRSFEFRAGSVDDYIARPKPNGYQSLHSCILVPPGGLPAEVQIRTWDMHAHAVKGSAQHWDYKRVRYAALPT